MLITIPGANFSGSGLGRVTRLINGMPSSGLLGLYLLDDDTVGSAAPDTLADSSGNGNHMTRYGSYASPTRRSYGLEVSNVNGAMYQTPIAAGRSEISILMAAKSLMPGDESTAYQAWTGASVNAYPTDPSASIVEGTYPVISLAGGVPGTQHFGVFDKAADMLGTNKIMMTGDPGLNKAAVICITFDGPDDTVAMYGSQGSFTPVVDTRIGDYFTGTSRGNVMLGCWGYGPDRTAASPQAQLYGYAVYDHALSSLEAADAIARMKAICVARGVTF